MLTRCVKAYSMSMLICNCFHKRLANICKIATFTGVPLFDRRNLRSVLNISYAASPCLSRFQRNSLLKCVSQPEIAKKSIKSLFWHSRSSKVIEFGGNREPAYDFLLVIIAHCYWDTATYWLKIANFSHPLLFNALVRGDPLWICRKALRFLKLVFQATNGEDLVILACIVFDWSTRVTERRTDGRTDRQNCDV